MSPLDRKLADLMHRHILVGCVSKERIRAALLRAYNYGLAKRKEIDQTERYCSSCGQVKPTTGGAWRTNKDSRRWKCAGCVAKQKSPALRRAA